MDYSQRHLTYDDAASTTRVVDSKGGETLYRHDGAVVHETTNPVGSVTRLEHDEHYNVLLCIDALGRTTRYERDEFGNAVAIHSPDGTSVSARYDDWGRRVEQTNEIGATSTREYDQAGRVIRRTDALGQTFEIGYHGTHETITSPQGGTTVVDRVDGNVVALHLPDGTTSRWEHDGWGRPTRAISPTGAFEQRRYDLCSRPTRVHDLEGGNSEFEYGPNLLASRIRHHNREVELRYVGMGRVASRTEAGLRLGFEYDSEENLTAIVDAAGGTRRFEYDPNGRLAARIDPAGRRTGYRRDPVGNVVQIDRPGGNFTRHIYDDADFIVSTTYSEGDERRYRYRADGELLEVANETTTVSFRRDLLGRVTQESRDGHWVSSGHGPTGRTEIRSSRGADQQITRDVMGDVVELRDGAFACTIDYDEFGFESQRVLSTNLWCRRRHDRFGREISQEIGRGSVAARSLATRWGPDDQIAEVADSAYGTTRYGHDVLGSLVWAQRPNGQTDLRMADRSSNLFRSSDRSDRGYGPAGELLWAQTDAGRVEYRYGPEGRLVEKRVPDGGVWSYRWNGPGQLVDVTRPDGASISFSYDPIGRRITKTVGDRTQHTLWDGGTPLHEWWTSADGAQIGAVDWIFEPGTLSPMAKREGEVVFGIVCDRLGSPQLMCNEDGEEVWSAAPNVFGKFEANSGDLQACPFRWPGQREDPETGLHYNRFRYYDPESGIYISPDPLREAGGLLDYAYPSDVLRGLDPYGLVGENKTIGDIAEKQAKKDLKKQGYEVLGPMENKSGHGIDLVVKNPDGDIEVVEVKANSSQLNPDQKKGADWYAQDRCEKCLNHEGPWNKKKPKAEKLANTVLDEISYKGQIKGKVMYYDVKDGKAKLRKTEPWVACK